MDTRRDRLRLQLARSSGTPARLGPATRRGAVVTTVAADFMTGAVLSWAIPLALLLATVVSWAIVLTIRAFKAR
jgi:hypothetical protein